MQLHKSYLLQEALKESANQPVNLDYRMGDKFLDLLWDRLSPEYKVAAVEGNWSTIYIVMPEADYNDYAEDLADRGSRGWEEIFEDIMDEYPVFDVLYKNGKIQLFASNDQCEMEFNPDDEDAEYKEYDSLDDFVDEVLGL